MGNNIQEEAYEVLMTALKGEIYDFGINYETYGVEHNLDNPIATDLVIEDLHISRHFGRARFHRITFHNCTLESTYFRECDFYGCSFINCKLIKIGFTGIYFSQCSFVKCEISSSTFHQNKLLDCNFSDSSFNGNLLSETNFISCIFVEFKILKVEIISSIFKNIITPSINSIGRKIDDDTLGVSFTECNLRQADFKWTNLSNFLFKKCNFQSLSFVNCTLRNKLFIDNIQENKDYNFLDLQTILHSEQLSMKILSTHFDVHTDELKEYVKSMVTKLEYQTVFISYSFKDFEFANILNETLRKLGVFTFFWQDNAPGGKRLTDIMSDNINKKDRLLFIASKNSIKSEACQFELSEARRKHRASWEDVFFPIHIDSFLFSVRKEIMPIDKQEEYWSNIIELKKFNSMDFSEFANSEIDETKFEEHVRKLVKSLRRES